MRWLSIDPGETVGWALWEDDQLQEAGQTPMAEFLDDVGAALNVAAVPSDGCFEFAPSEGELFEGVELLVIERFVLYPWKANDLEWDELRTSQAIGVLRWIAHQGGVRVELQPATIKEPAMEGGARELFLTPLDENRHANDAIMHGWYYIAVHMRGVKIQLPSAELLVLDPDEAYSLRGSGDGGA